MKLQILEATSKSGNTYYGLFVVNGDFKVLVKFLTKFEYENLSKQKGSL